MKWTSQLTRKGYPDRWKLDQLWCGPHNWWQDIKNTLSRKCNCTSQCWDNLTWKDSIPRKYWHQILYITTSSWGREKYPGYTVIDWSIWENFIHKTRKYEKPSNQEEIIFLESCILFKIYTILVYLFDKPKMKPALSPISVGYIIYDELVKMIVQQNFMFHKHGLMTTRKS